MTETKTKHLGAIIHCRVSTSKQAQEGESLETQSKICQSLISDRGWHLVHKPWLIAFSGRKKDRDDFDNILDFLDANIGLVKYYVTRSIDRFTRSGPEVYEQMKRELGKRGVEIVDSQGIIQPAKNTLEHTGFSYEWSEVSPSKISEVVMATTANQEVTSILTRLIGQQINLAQQGYAVRSAHDGYVNKRIYVEGKKRTIQVEDPIRGKFFSMMFDLRAQGLYTDQEIVDRLNAIGYRTKLFNRWDKSHQINMGQSGGNLLTTKRMQKFIKNPVYCGVITEKWTHYRPIKASFQGLVTIDVFNKANRGKVFIKEDSDGQLKILYNYNLDREVKHRLKYNPLYPYKFILCPHCKNEVCGSASTGKTGRKFPVYHCSRNHSRFAVPKNEFDSAVEKYISNLNFEPAILNSLHAVFLDRHRERQGEIMQTASEVGHSVADLELQKAQATKAYISATSNELRQSIELEIENLGNQIKDAQAERNKLEVTESDIDGFIKEVKKIMEHPAEMLLNTVNLRQQKELFGLVFEEIPTYEQIVNGTPRLSFIFRQNKNFSEEKSLLVAPQGIEP